MSDQNKEIQEFVRKKAFSHCKTETMILCPDCKGYGFIEIEENECIDCMGYCTILGYIPITLARVLNALKLKEIGYFDDYLVKQENGRYDDDLISICKWVLLKRDGSETTFQDQSTETQLAIAQLLGYEGGGDE